MSEHPDETTADVPTTTRRELRLALAMRGGVSLSVWLGGACAEIDLLRRAGLELQAGGSLEDGTGNAGPTPGTDAEGIAFWKEVLVEKGYDGVAVDVMTGASAGGLNAALFLVAQRYGVPFGAFKQVWLDRGQIDRLTRVIEQTDEERAKNPPRSLLDGDGAFLDPVAEEMIRLIDELGTKPDVQHALDVQLTGTHVVPMQRRTPSPTEEEQWAERSGATFRYRISPVGGGSLPPYAAVDSEVEGAREAFEQAIWRVAIGARATSAFPGAFEPASVTSVRPPTFGTEPTAELAPTTDKTGGAKPTTRRRTVNLQGVFTDARTASDSADAPTSFAVMDGGVLDNIPLGRALQTVAASPADGRTDRKLLYLQPGAPNGPKAASDAAAPDERSLPAVVGGLIRSHVTPETIATDIEALEAHNRAVARGKILRAEALRVHDPADVNAAWQELHTRAGQVIPVYQSMRTSTEVARVRTLLDDPVAVTGLDGLPANVAHPTDPLAYWSTEAREDLDAKLAEALRPPSIELDASLFLHGLGPIQRSTTLAIDWILDLEEWAARGLEGAERTTVLDRLGQQKQRAYAVRRFVEVRLNGPRRTAWLVLASNQPVEPAGGAGDPVGRWCTKGFKLTERLTRGASMPADIGDPDEHPGTGLSEVHQVLEVVAAGGQPSASLAHDLRTAVLDALVDIVGEVNGALPTVDPAPDVLLHRVLGGQDAQSRPPIHRLAVLELLCLPEFIDGAPGQRTVSYRRISAAEKTPNRDRFKALKTADTASSTPMWGDAPGGPGDPAAAIPLSVKLAGNELGNFSAFLDPAWRENDWMWGRLDACVGLLDLLGRPPDAGIGGVSRYDQILHEELVEARRAASNRGAASTGDPEEPFVLATAIKTYDVGAQTVGKLHSEGLVWTAQQLAESAAEVIEWNATQMGAGSARAKPIAARLAWVVRYGGLIAARIAFGPSNTSRKVLRSIAKPLGQLLIGVVLVIGAVVAAERTGQSLRSIATFLGVLSAGTVLAIRSIPKIARKAWMAVRPTARSSVPGEQPAHVQLAPGPAQVAVTVQQPASVSESQQEATTTT